MELSPPSDDKPDQGAVTVTVECSPSASPEYSGRGASELNAELSNFLLNSFSYPSTLDLKSLCVLPGEQVWTVHIDALVLDAAGNLADLLLITTKAALLATKIPKIEVIQNEEEGISEISVADDPDEATPFVCDGVPLSLTFAMIGGYFVVDPTDEEEQCVSSSITVSIAPNGHIVCVKKSGEEGLDFQILQDSISTAPALADKLLQSIKASINR